MGNLGVYKQCMHGQHRVEKMYILIVAQFWTKEGIESHIIHSYTDWQSQG